MALTEPKTMSTHIIFLQYLLHMPIFSTLMICKSWKKNSNE
jgi:hypothetical protein